MGVRRFLGVCRLVVVAGLCDAPSGLGGWFGCLWGGVAA